MLMVRKLLEEDAKKKLEEILKNGAAVVIDGGLQGRIEESYQNLKKLAEALIANAEKKKKKAAGGPAAYFMFDDEQLVVTAKSTTAALNSICPLFPFCV